MAWDDMKDRELDPKEVVKARGVEMGYVRQHGVYEYASVSECGRKTGADPVGTKWLDTNKGDEKCTGHAGSPNNTEGPGWKLYFRQHPTSRQFACYLPMQRTGAAR